MILSNMLLKESLSHRLHKTEEWFELYSGNRDEMKD
jgi:hypothetical protein